MDSAATAKVRFDERERRADGAAFRWLGRKMIRADFSNRCCSTSGGADHLDRVNEYFRFVRFNRITTKRIERRGKGDRLTVNGKHRFVTGISGKFFDMLVIIAEGNGETIHFDPEPLLEQFLRADNFISDPLLVFGPGQFCPGPLPAGGSQHYIMSLAQVLVRRSMRFDIDSVVTHVG